MRKREGSSPSPRTKLSQEITKWNQMKIVDTKSSIRKSKNKKSTPNYSSWDALTQARYLFDLHQQIGQKISLKEAYELAVKAVNSN
ncbi:MAG TPA: hypothetical protein PLU50_07145 [Pseudobdellovibrionaceae bacterium]|nr:hypothetical protein [Pseudobdellovibrionaceae bacterium]